MQFLENLIGICLFLATSVTATSERGKCWDEWDNMEFRGNFREVVGGDLEECKQTCRETYRCHIVKLYEENGESRCFINDDYVDYESTSHKVGYKSYFMVSCQDYYKRRPTTTTTTTTTTQPVTSIDLKTTSDSLSTSSGSDNYSVEKIKPIVSDALSKNSNELNLEDLTSSPERQSTTATTQPASSESEKTNLHESLEAGDDGLGDLCDDSRPEEPETITTVSTPSSIGSELGSVEREAESNSQDVSVTTVDPKTSADSLSTPSGSDNNSAEKIKPISSDAFSKNSNDGLNLEDMMASPELHTSHGSIRVARKRLPSVEKSNPVVIDPDSKNSIDDSKLEDGMSPSEGHSDRESSRVGGEQLPLAELPWLSLDLELNLKKFGRKDSGKYLSGSSEEDIASETNPGQSLDSVEKEGTLSGRSLFTVQSTHGPNIPADIVNIQQNEHASQGEDMDGSPAGKPSDTSKVRCKTVKDTTPDKELNGCSTTEGAVVGESP